MNCQFCEDIFQRNREQGLPEESSVVYQDENIYVMPDISPLAVGHMLIVAKKHYQGYASAGNETLQSVEKFLDYYREKIGYRNYTIFEHGAVIPYSAGASIDHAHIHIVPFELHMKNILDLEHSDHVLCAMEELPDFAYKQQSYIFYKLASEERGYAYPVGRIKSQYLRDMANQLMKKKSEYDWKKIYKQSDSYIGFWKTLAWWQSLEYASTFKWKKKLILEKYGLVSYLELLEETTRFRWDQREIVVTMLRKELERDSRNYYRLVLVPTEHQYKLSNFVVTAREDIEMLDRFFDSQQDYNEIWYFVGSSRKEQDEFSGRISYCRTSAGVMEIVEMVSGDNPRKLEKYTIRNSGIDYLRLVRIEGKTAYNVEDVQVGEKYRDSDQWLKCFGRLYYELKAREDNLYAFRTMVQKHGIHSLSLDFQVVDTTFSFVDWDTSNDERILKNERI